LLELARVAAGAGATLFSVGSELSTLDGEGDRSEWMRTIAQVRRVFAGPLVYSGNWDHYQEVAIYDLVDFMGVCGYFALAEPGAPTAVADLVRGWRDARAEVERFARRRAEPLLFTEVGYRSQRGAAAAPWDEGSRGIADLDEQDRCYQAFRRVWQTPPSDALAGVYFWNWYGWGGAGSRSYTPRGKPAAEEIRLFFNR
jgi:hypothetical protein